MTGLANASTGKIFEVLFTSFICSIIFALLSISFSKKTGLIDRPLSEAHKQHKRNVPIAGGLALFCTITICIVFFRKIITKELVGVYLSSIIIFAFGLLDDYKRIKPRAKVIAQAVATTMLIFSGTRIQIFESFGNISENSIDFRFILDLGLTYFWVVFITNAYNLIDSMDGLMLGIASWAMVFFILAAMDAEQFSLGIFCAIIFGSCMALSFFNSYPAFLFMGDSGAQTIGFLFSAIAIIYSPQEKLQSTTWFMPILLLGIPIFDSTLVIISRTRKGRPFFSSGVDHTYHRLIALGLSNIQAVLFLQLTSLMLEIIAFIAISQTPKNANIIFFAIVIAGIGAIVLFDCEAKWKQKLKNKICQAEEFKK